MQAWSQATLGLGRMTARLGGLEPLTGHWEEAAPQRSLSGLFSHLQRYLQKNDWRRRDGAGGVEVSQLMFGEHVLRPRTELDTSYFI